MERAVALRAQLKEVAETAGGTVPSFNDMVVKASALALREYPRANGSYRDGRFELYARVNVGVAVAAQDALVVPTVFDADRKSLGEIARDAARAGRARARQRDHAARARRAARSRSRTSACSGSTSFTRRHQPAAGGDPRGRRGSSRRAVVRDGEIVARNMMSADARLRPPDPLRRRRRASSSARIRALLEQPLALAL